MKAVPVIAILAAGLAASPAAAEVVSASPNAFHVRQEIAITGDPAQAFALLRRPQDWWSDAHTYSRDAGNFILDLSPGGCLCEAWDGGFVKHLEVVSLRPGSQIVMEGGLGPLRYQPAGGTMVWELIRGESGLMLAIDYKVTGFPDGNGQALASAVDGVLGEQAQRFAAALAR